MKMGSDWPVMAVIRPELDTTSKSTPRFLFICGRPIFQLHEPVISILSRDAKKGTNVSATAAQSGTKISRAADFGWLEAHLDPMKVEPHVPLWNLETDVQ
jgi:hypothetical protein